MPLYVFVNMISVHLYVFGIGVGLPFLHLLTGMVIIQVRDFAPIGLRAVGSTPRREWWNAGVLEKWVLASG
jgi:hypothetical protein